MQTPTPLERKKHGIIKTTENTPNIFTRLELYHMMQLLMLLAMFLPTCTLTPCIFHVQHETKWQVTCVPCHAIEQVCKSSGSISLYSHQISSSGTWLATPTGQLFVWQMRAITQPVAIIATEPNPYSSAPIVAAIRTSTPLLKPPSTLRMTRSLSPFSMSVCKKLKYYIIRS